MRVKITSDGTRSGTRVENLDEPGKPIVTCSDGLRPVVRAIQWTVMEDGQPACFLFYGVRVDAEVDVEAEGGETDGLPRRLTRGGGGKDR